MSDRYHADANFRENGPNCTLTIESARTSPERFDVGRQAKFVERFKIDKTGRAAPEG